MTIKKQVRMTTLRKLGLLAVSAAMILGMSSCLKTSDPGFQFGVNKVYMEQFGYSENVRFKPVIQIFSNEAIAKVSAKCPGDVILFAEPADITYKMLWNLLPISYSIDSIPNGVYTITASNLEGEITQGSVTFMIDKKMGELKEKTFTYKASEGIKATWDKVDNATGYYLAARQSGDEIWDIFSWREGAGSNVVEGSYNPAWNKDSKVELAILAAYSPSPTSGTLITVGPVHSIVWGTDLVAPENE